jgi:primosomal protein N' (replication factor Y)
LQAKNYTMLYAKVVVGLPVEGPFDYIVPLSLHSKIKVGSRVWVLFGTRSMLGYVAGLTRKTNIKNLKTVLEVIDDLPILDKNMLLLSKELSDYYGCSLGEAIEAALPEPLRKGKPLPRIDNSQLPDSNLCKTIVEEQNIVLIHDLSVSKRWDIYIREIKETIASGKQAIMLFPDLESVLKAKAKIETELHCPVIVLYRKQPQELGEWCKTKTGKACISIGTRSNVFTPFNNLGLLIIEEEQEGSYKQDQVPHYHARVAAFMRTNIEKAKLILGSATPSLETFYLTQKSEINIAAGASKNYAEPKRALKYIFIPRDACYPEVKIIDTSNLFLSRGKKSGIISKYLEDNIASTLGASGRVLIFLNRSGFATSAYCHNCGVILKCERCNINLVYHFKENILSCHYCNFKMQSTQICPRCNSGYIKHSGFGTEKVENELARVFPQAKIKRLDRQEKPEFSDAGIFIATSYIFKEAVHNFDLVVVLAIDNSLNRFDFRASEKTFALLTGLTGLTDKKILIQTSLPHHHCFRALVNNNAGIFYEEELRQRQQLEFPPYQHIGLVKLRGKNDSRVKDISSDLFKKLNKYKTKGIKVLSVSPGQPSKLRGNFYWQVLIKAGSAYRITKFLKKHLKDFRHSGIIVTIDIDPV